MVFDYLYFFPKQYIPNIYCTVKAKYTLLSTLILTQTLKLPCTFVPFLKTDPVQLLKQVNHQDIRSNYIITLAITNIAHS